ncbi:Protein of unknown function (DUF3352) [Cylindrospermum stagnale PCC 7417]|uniref:DUF3352 domain-containing protein n=1 Tax=Cylindrospermum stagnale PCC 7417 TaxID=56107 RepID=K9X2M0_9NOST|nr:DUF3352 domain-containing protein [Cylindrospermum stagnale]AFZ26329.1 Protein of unknown function (DUF3352) [Cylindrospermum stagnale PCC 7417]
MNRQSSFFGFLVAGAIALLLIGITGFYWFFAKTPVNLVASTGQPGAAIFVSKLAPVMVSLLANPDRLQALERDGELSQLKTSLLAKSSINYKQDIQPWLGKEITLAVTTLDIDREPENGQQPGYLMALATEKPEKSREFVELLFSRRVLAGANLAVEQYKGVKLIYDNQENLAGAVVGDKFVLFANDLKVLRAAINNVQAPDENLTSSAKYQKATQQLPKGAVALAFLNLPTVAAWQGLQLSEPTYDSQIISLVLNPQGLLAETTFLSRSEVVPPSPPLSQPVGALKYIPASAGLAISGANLRNLGDSNLAQFWRQATATIYGSGEDALVRLAQPLVDIQKRWGINLASDIFSWVGGEYAIALLPSAGKTTPAWVFAVEKLPAVVEGVGRLDAIASANGFNISSLTLGKQKVSAWTELTAATKDQLSLTVEAKVKGAHTTIDNYEIFTSNLETMDKILTAKETALIDNPDFQDSVALIPQPNQGYIYLDWTKSKSLLERQLPILKFVEILGKPLFNNLRSLTVSSYGNETTALKGGVFFQLQGR